MKNSKYREAKKTNQYKPSEMRRRFERGSSSESSEISSLSCFLFLDFFSEEPTKETKRQNSETAKQTAKQWQNNGKRQKAKQNSAKRADRREEKKKNQTFFVPAITDFTGRTNTISLDLQLIQLVLGEIACLFLFAHLKIEKTKKNEKHKSAGGQTGQKQSMNIDRCIKEKQREAFAWVSNLAFFFQFSLFKAFLRKILFVPALLVVYMVVSLLKLLYP
jgi:hypothetical protein